MNMVQVDFFLFFLICRIDIEKTKSNLKIQDDVDYLNRTGK